MSAWAVNQAYWQGRERFQALLQAGDTLRDLQKRALGGESCAGDIQAAMLARRAALHAVKEHAENALERDGHGAGNATMRRVTTTLEALAVYGTDPSAPQAGRLSADVPAPGFGALSALAETAEKTAAVPTSAASADAVGTAPSPAGDGGRRSANDNQILSGAELQARDEAVRAREQARARAREQARLALEEARADVAARQRAIENARALEKTALDRVYAAEKAIENAQRELARARDTRDQALRSAEEAKADTRAALSAASHAEVLLGEAQQRLADLVGRDTE